MKFNTQKFVYTQWSSPSGSCLASRHISASLGLGFASAAHSLGINQVHQLQPRYFWLGKWNNKRSTRSMRVCYVSDIGSALSALGSKFPVLSLLGSRHYYCTKIHWFYVYNACSFFSNSYSVTTQSPSALTWSQCGWLPQFHLVPSFHCFRAASAVQPLPQKIPQLHHSIYRRQLATLWWRFHDSTIK